MIQYLSFDFDDWETLLEWKHRQAFVVVYLPQSNDPDYWYLLESWGPGRYYIRRVSNELVTGVPLGRVLRTEQLVSLRSNVFRPTQPGQYVVARDTAEIDWPACLKKASKAGAVRTWSRHDPLKGLLLTRLGELTYDSRHNAGAGGPGLMLGTPDKLELLADPDLAEPDHRPHLRNVRRALLDANQDSHCIVC